jgi:hypothetical protein
MWSQIITSSSIDYKPSATGGYIGDGVQVYVENPEGTISDLPSIGTSFIDIGTGVAYSGINLQSITITHTHKSNGTGRTATCNFSSSEKQDIKENDTFGSYTGNVKKVSQESKTAGNSNWAWYNGALLGNDPNFDQDFANSSGIAGNTLQWLIPQGSFRRRYIIESDDEFNDFKTEFVDVAGKINSTPFEGFDVGNVLLVSFDADKKFINGAEKWDVYCNYNWQIIPDITQDCFQYIPNAIFDLELFKRPVRVERSGGAGIIRNVNLLYKYADLDAFDTTWTAQ